MNAAAMFNEYARAANECVRCGLEIWSCCCDPTRPYRQPTPEEIEAARCERLTRAERTNEDERC